MFINFVFFDFELDFILYFVCFRAKDIYQRNFVCTGMLSVYLTEYTCLLLKNILWYSCKKGRYQHE
jgi:hypothetical protein